MNIHLVSLIKRQHYQRLFFLLAVYILKQVRDRSSKSFICVHQNIFCLTLQSTMLISLYVPPASRNTLYPQKLALTSPTSGGRSVGIVRLRTKATKSVPPALTLKHDLFTQWFCVVAFDFQNKQGYLLKQRQVARLIKEGTVCVLGILKKSMIQRVNPRTVQ
jgi:hypothetical protein